MNLLITTDIHLDHNPDHDYRWKALDVVGHHLDGGSADVAIIAGDITDAKDRHPAKFVNRVVDRIEELAKRKRLIIVKGNHDYIDPACPFFKILGKLPNVTFVSEPIAIELGGTLVLFVPHGVSWNHESEWRKRLPLREFDLIIAHETFNGSIASNGQELPGVPLATVSRKVTGGAPVICGDIHVPQQVGNVTYIGAPHAVRFGDTYDPRMLVWDTETRKVREIANPGIRRVVAEFVLDEESDSIGCITQFDEGDHVKARFFGKQSDLQHWPDIRERIRHMIERRRARCFGEEYLVDRPEILQSKITDTDGRDDSEVFADHCQRVGVDEAVALAAFDGWFGEAKNDDVVQRSDFQLHAISIRGFRSFLDDVAFQYPDTPGVYLLTGKNGDGKSSFFEALYWCLYGRTSVGLIAKQIAHWSGDAETSVVVEGYVDGRLVAVTRTWNPNALTIQRGLNDAEKVTQPEVDRLIGVDRDQFLACAYFAQKGTKFMDRGETAQLSAVSRLLNLKRWDDRIAAAKLSRKSAGHEVAKCDRSLARAEKALEICERQHVDATSESLSWQSKADTADYMAQCRDWLLGLERDLSDHEGAYHVARARLDSFQTSQTQWTERVAELSGGAEECPTCGAELEVTAEETAQNITDLSEAHHCVGEATVALNKFRKTLRDHKTRVDESRTRHARALQYSDEGDDGQEDPELEAEIKAIEVTKQSNPFTQQIERLGERVDEARTELQGCRVELSGFRGTVETATVAARLYGDVRASLLRSAALEYQTYFSNSLPQLGLEQWDVKCTAIDEEGQADWLIQVTSPKAPDWVDFRAYSGGEYTRLCLAGEAAYSDLARARAGIAMDFEIWDEPARWLDPEGLADLMGFLRWRSTVLEKKVWLIEHQTTHAGEVTKHWQVTRDTRGTRIAPA